MDTKQALEKLFSQKTVTLSDGREVAINRVSVRTLGPALALLAKVVEDLKLDITKGIDTSVDKNIEAGSKYMRLLADKYLDDPELTPVNRTLMSFAAYNAGPGNLMKFRRLAEKSGLDPNVWFGNVEQAAARIVGRETVDYVGNIYKYYVVYKLAEQKLRERAKASQQPGS